MKFDKIRHLAAVLVLVGWTTGCDNPVSTEEDHREADGIVILNGSTEVARRVGATITGALTVSAGATSPVLTAVFVDHEGQTINIPSGYYLRVESSSESVAVWEPNTPGAFSGRIRGQAAGTAQLHFRLWHGAVGSGHADGEAQSITITVTT